MHVCVSTRVHARLCVCVNGCISMCTSICLDTYLAVEDLLLFQRVVVQAGDLAVQVTGGSMAPLQHHTHHSAMGGPDTSK